MTVLLSPSTLLHLRCYFLLSREEAAVAICQRIQVFLFGSLHMQAWLYITYLHQYTQAYLHTGVQTESNQNKHWTTLLTAAPGNPISQYDMRHD